MFIPCLLSAQADRRFEENESFDLKIIADIINSCEFTRVEIFDPHSDVTGALINNSHIVTNAEFIMDTLSKINSIAGWDYGDIVLVSPDAGAFKKIYKLAKDINFEGEIITCSKSRDNSKGELELRVPKFPEGKVALIIDDICLGGRTFTTIAEKLRENGYSEKQMFLAISHGIFNQGFEKLKDHFTKIYVTNSKQESYANDFMKTIIYKII